jgi:hypothetical protein
MRFQSIQIIFGAFFMISSCNRPVTGLSYDKPDTRVLFLHHSTGENVWNGDIDKTKSFLFRKITCMTPRLMKEYNDQNGKKISLEEQNFPKGKAYPWSNDPYDYYNIWVKNAGDTHYMTEPTLEMLTKKYDLIIFKHCFPVSKIVEDDNKPDVNSKIKTLANYKLQYNALKEKLHTFPKTKFIVWTGAALVESQTNDQEARRAKEFSEWVKNEWDQPSDNIFIFDFRELETQGGLYLKPEYAVSSIDSHPNKSLSTIASKSLVNRIIEVIGKN